MGGLAPFWMAVSGVLAALSAAGGFALAVLVARLRRARTGADGRETPAAAEQDVAVLEALERVAAASNRKLWADRVSSALTTLTGVPAAAIVLRTPGSDTMSLAGSSVPLLIPNLEPTVRDPHGPSRRALASGEPAAMGAGEMPGWAVAAGFEAGAVLPILFHGASIGLAYLLGKAREEPLAETLEPAFRLVTLAAVHYSLAVPFAAPALSSAAPASTAPARTPATSTAGLVAAATSATVPAGVTRPAPKPEVPAPRPAPVARPAQATRADSIPGYRAHTGDGASEPRPAGSADAGRLPLTAERPAPPPARPSPSAGRPLPSAARLAPPAPAPGSGDAPAARPGDAPAARNGQSFEPRRTLPAAEAGRLAAKTDPRSRVAAPADSLPAASSAAAAAEAPLPAPVERRRIDLPGLVVDPGTERCVIDGQAVALSRTEFDVVYALAANGGEVVTFDRLVRSVWGGASTASGSALDVTVHRIRKKLGRAPGGADLVRTVRGKGYALSVGEAGKGRQPAASR